VYPGIVREMSGNFTVSGEWRVVTLIKSISQTKFEVFISNEVKIASSVHNVNLAGILGTQEQIQKHGWGRRVGSTGGGARGKARPHLSHGQVIYDFFFRCVSLAVKKQTNQRFKFSF